MANFAKADGVKKTRRGKRGSGRGSAASLVDGPKTVQGLNRGQLLQMLSSWDGARRSERRGFVVLPGNDPKTRVSPTERKEIAAKVEAGEQNVGFIKRAIEGVSGLVGNLRPQAATGNEEFDEALEERILARFEHARAFDAAGMMAFDDWQSWVRESKVRAGDCLSVLSEGSDGGARLVMYEAGQIGSDSAAGKVENEVDGVFLDRSGGRAGFRLLDGRGRTAAIVPRERSIYHGGGNRVGRPRQVSGLAHAVANFLDMVEIVADTKHAVKVAALWGAWLERSPGTGGADDIGESLRGFLETAGESAEVLGGLDDIPVPGSNVDPGNVLSVDDFTQGGRFQEFGEGQTLKTMQDTRPSPNVLALLSWLIRDMARGAGLAPEVLWDASGMNGPGMRFVMAETRRFVEDQQRINRRDCQKVWMYFAAKEIQAGRVIVPAGLEGWWKASWIPQADLTIDRGRDGKLELEQMEKGKMTAEEFWGGRGKDWKTQEEKIIRERIWREEMEAKIRGGVS
jgi:capsid protein